MAAKKPDNMTFEETLGELESIVAALEQGELNLDESLKQFERGIALSRAGADKLRQAEQKVSILLGQDSSTALSPFDNSDDENQ